MAVHFVINHGESVKQAVQNRDACLKRQQIVGYWVAPPSPPPDAAHILPEHALLGRRVGLLCSSMLEEWGG